MPLGAACRGRCTLGGSEPDETELRELCNRGYARGRCSRFPADPATADAVRFSVAGETEAGIGIIYILEKDYGPLRHSTLTFHAGAGEFIPAPESAAIEAQARTFVHHYRNRRLKH